MGFKGIIAAIDFSSGAREAFSRALALARQHQARLTLVHVMPPLITPSPLLDDLVVNQTTLALRDDLRESCAKELAQLQGEAGQGVEVDTRLLEGDPARELTILAREMGADLLVLGNTGVSGLAETVFGSVAQKVVRRAPCSVLVARPIP
jgi:nucleotide-binding universal stress UspA family protein